MCDYIGMEKITKAEKKELRKQEKQEWEVTLQKEESRKMWNRVMLWGVVVLLIVGGLWGLINISSQPATPTISDVTKIPRVSAGDMTQGPKNAKVVLIEYADFQCPACGAYYPRVKQLQKDFNGKLLFVYRFFPLINIHRNALVSSEAGYAASKQGKFWEMHDLLFAHQADWAEKTNDEAMILFVGYAQSLGLNIDQLKKDMSDPATSKFIMDQENKGTDNGIQGTPTFYVNYKQLENPQTYEEFKGIIASELK